MVISYSQLKAISSKRVCFLSLLVRTGLFLNHLLRAEPARSALLENEIPYSLIKAPKTHAVQVGCSVLNAINLENVL